MLALKLSHISKRGASGPLWRAKVVKHRGDDMRRRYVFDY